MTIQQSLKKRLVSGLTFGLALAALTAGQSALADPVPRNPQPFTQFTEEVQRGDEAKTADLNGLDRNYEDPTGAPICIEPGSLGQNAGNPPGSLGPTPGQGPGGAFDITVEPLRASLSDCVQSVRVTLQQDDAFLRDNLPLTRSFRYRVVNSPVSTLVTVTFVKASPVVLDENVTVPDPGCAVSGVREFDLQNVFPNYVNKNQLVLVDPSNPNNASIDPTNPATFPNPPARIRTNNGFIEQVQSNDANRFTLRFVGDPGFDPGTSPIRTQTFVYQVLEPSARNQGQTPPPNSRSRSLSPRAIVVITFSPRTDETDPTLSIRIDGQENRTIQVGDTAIVTINISSFDPGGEFPFAPSDQNSGREYGTFTRIDRNRYLYRAPFEVPIGEGGRIGVIALNAEVVSAPNCFGRTTRTFDSAEITIVPREVGANTSNPPATPGVPGLLVRVPVQLSLGSDVAGATVHVNYDPRVLQANPRVPDPNDPDVLNPSVQTFQLASGLEGRANHDFNVISPGHIKIVIASNNNEALFPGQPSESQNRNVTLGFLTFTVNTFVQPGTRSDIQAGAVELVANEMVQVPSQTPPQLPPPNTNNEPQHIDVLASRPLGQVLAVLNEGDVTRARPSGAPQNFDVNLPDCQITVQDIRRTIQFILRIAVPNAYQRDAADVNDDLEINVFDIIRILRNNVINGQGNLVGNQFGAQGCLAEQIPASANNGGGGS